MSSPVPTLTTSKVFADAHSVSAGEKKVELVDRDGTAKLLRVFLKLTSTGELEVDFSLTGILELAQFGHKWDCPASLVNIQPAVRYKVSQGKAIPVFAFALAAAIDDLETATIALGMHQWTWGDFPNVSDPIRTALCFNPRTWSIHMWRRMANHPEYLFALNRAFEEVGASDQMAIKFTEYLAAAKAAPTVQ